jgi:GNAT superfamily N-acetyltransferase
MAHPASEIRLDQIERRPATQADVAFLLELRRQTMTGHQVDAGLVPSEDERRERVLARYDCAEILSYAGRPLGLWKVVREGKAWDLIQIQLQPEYQGLGLGKALIEGLIEEARAAGASIGLQVLNGNPARRLYERLGFEVVAEAEHFMRMQVTPR